MASGDLQKAVLEHPKKAELLQTLSSMSALVGLVRDCRAECSAPRNHTRQLGGLAGWVAAVILFDFCDCPFDKIGEPRLPQQFKGLQATRACPGTQNRKRRSKENVSAGACHSGLQEVCVAGIVATVQLKEAFTKASRARRFATLGSSRVPGHSGVAGASAGSRTIGGTKVRYAYVGRFRPRHRRGTLGRTAEDQERICRDLKMAVATDWVLDQLLNKCPNDKKEPRRKRPSHLPLCTASSGMSEGHMWGGHLPRTWPRSCRACRPRSGRRT